MQMNTESLKLFFKERMCTINRPMKTFSTHCNQINIQDYERWGYHWVILHSLAWVKPLERDPWDHIFYLQVPPSINRWWYQHYWVQAQGKWPSSIKPTKKEKDYYLTPVEMTIIKKKRDSKGGWYMEKYKVLCTTGINVNLCCHNGK